MKKIVIAPDSFKGTFTSTEASEIIAGVLRKKYGNEIECIIIPIADGGEGTSEAFRLACSGRSISVPVHNPIGEKINAEYCVLPGGTAVIETASASGITLVDPLEPMKSSTYGTGEMIADALGRGIRNIFITLGGSATTDGGTGCISALGGKFLNENGEILKGCGENLTKIRKIDLSSLDERLKETKITVLCDVENPLCGKNGAAYVFSPQKGADENQVRELESGLRNLKHLTEQYIGKDFSSEKGTGAAGGLGFALMSFLSGEFKSGLDCLLDFCRFEEKIAGADLIITGEGKMDSQSLKGKVPFGIAKRAGGIPVTAIVGVSLISPEEAISGGISRVIETNPLHRPFNEIRHKCRDMLISAAESLLL